jgi:TRAP-type uncharacterized transport system substrate-binding protein
MSIVAVRKDYSTRGVFVMLALVTMTWVISTGHTPYRQWVVFRERHLIVLTSRTDGSSYELGKRVAEVLATHLPASRARVARAPNMERIGSLISTKQFDVALLSRNYAAAMLHGLPPFDEHGPVPLRTIIELGDYLLVCRNDFPARHAYLVAMTLSIHRAKLPSAVARKTQNAEEPTAEVPMHPGVSADLAGRPLPESGEAPGDQ